ncbi:MFS general substrate transporter [Aspergillus taichungensis]|uniref:MFS general substrate transporter n=1 Tax=Aspergillus taichungensis TaxID=482145 RepID=A0A2J5I2G4_9EURO|nr:MFS general substrate transporter [Aspergillus taichungensis]
MTRMFLIVGVIGFSCFLTLAASARPFLTALEIIVSGQDKYPVAAKEKPSSDLENGQGNDSRDHVEPIVSLKTWVVACILSCGYGLSFWPVPVMSAIGVTVSAELGDPAGYMWYIPLTALEICTIGHIVVASAKTSNQITAGFAISGFGGANCQMAAFALPELLPNKWRHIGVVIADFTVYIAVILGPVTARFGQEYGTWEWNFWSVAIFQGLSFFGLLFLYFPPARPSGIPRREAFKSLDYFGGFLFMGGAIPVLLGIVWAGVYPSTDPHVVATLVVGFFVLTCFAVWETFGPVKFPLTPSYIFASSWGRDFTAPAIALGVVNMFYYSSSILWPQMTTVLYTNGGTDWRYAIVLTLPQGLAIAFGAFLLSTLGSKIRHWQWQLTGAVFIMVLFGSLLGLATPTNKGTMIAFLFLSQVGFGWGIYLSIAITQMGVDQKNLGVSGGVSGAIRYAAGAVATTIYNTVFTTTLTKWTTRLVPKAVIAAGLPESKVSDVITAMQSSEFAKAYSPDVVAAATLASKEATCKAVFAVAMVSMAFGIVGIFACLCCKDVDHKMTNQIEVYLTNTDQADRNKHN